VDEMSSGRNDVSEKIFAKLQKKDKNFEDSSGALTICQTSTLLATNGKK
jgi:hypothetical protein